MIIDLPPLLYIPPFSLARINEKAASRELRRRGDQLEYICARQRVVFKDRYPLKEYSAGALNEEQKLHSATNIDNHDNKEVKL